MNTGMLAIPCTVCLPVCLETSIKALEDKTAKDSPLKAGLISTALCSYYGHNAHYFHGPVCSIRICEGFIYLVLWKLMIRRSESEERSKPPITNLQQKSTVC
jgi:hypothetical protein